ncbi:MAG: hypothetical protein MI923_21545 [Phycisphaerales bacterium]|nr:hypothetical protein [Phycisphaerales bacterium]
MNMHATGTETQSVVDFQYISSPLYSRMHDDRVLDNFMAGSGPCDACSDFVSFYSLVTQSCPSFPKTFSSREMIVDRTKPEHDIA